MSYLSPLAGLASIIKDLEKTVKDQQKEIELLNERINKQAETIDKLHEENKTDEEKYTVINMFGNSKEVITKNFDLADNVAMFLLGRNVPEYLIIKHKKDTYRPVHLAFPFEYNNVVKQLEQA
jgi:hypothetical protein